MSSYIFYPSFRGYLNSGAPNAGGSVSTFVAGTATPLATYSDAALTVPNATTVVLDANGEAIMFTGPLAYKLVEKDSLGATLRTWDNYSPAQAVASPTITQWTPVLTAAGAAPTFAFISSVSFTVNAGVDLIATYGLGVGDRIRTTNTAGTVYSTITAISYAAPNNTITVVNDGVTVIDAGISALAFGMTRYVSPSYLDPRTVLLLTKSGNLVGAAGSTKIITWTSQIDSNGEWDAANNQWKCRYPGNYLIDLQAELSDTTANQAFTVAIGLAGAAVCSYFYTCPAVGGTHLAVSARRLLNLVAGQLVTFWIGGTGNTTVYGGATVGTLFQITRLP